MSSDKNSLKVGLVFPHQLFENSWLLTTCHTIYLVEEWLYFKQYNFHKSKLIFHRASMKYYASYLQAHHIKVKYIESNDDHSDIRKLIPILKSIGIEELAYIATTDNWLEHRINKACEKANKKNYNKMKPTPQVSKIIICGVTPALQGSSGVAYNPKACIQPINLKEK